LAASSGECGIKRSRTGCIAAIDDLGEQDVIAFALIDRNQNLKLRRILDQAFSVGRRQANVLDDGIPRILRIDGGDATGQYIPFPNTIAQRTATSDPRP
jgi:hypothetical protein